MATVLFKTSNETVVDYVAYDLVFLVKLAVLGFQKIRPGLRFSDLL